MYELQLKGKMVHLSKIVLPILITQITLYLISFFDILMTSRYNSDHLAGVAIGSSLWIPVYTGLSGILVAVTPIIAHLVGANEKKNIKQVVQQGIYFSIALSILVLIVILLALPIILDHMSLETTVFHIAKGYVTVLSIGILPLFMYSVLRGFIDALGKTRVTMIITLLSTPVNIFFNYVFIFGHFGAPELGGIGAALASAISYWVVLAIAVIILIRNEPFASYSVFQNWSRISFAKWKEISQIGVPIGLSIFAETSIFSAVTLLMSAYSTEVISAHQIALNFTSLLYMVPLSISFGATVVVGQAVGANHLRDAKVYSWLSVAFAIVFSFISAFILVFFRDGLAHLYTTNTEVIQWTVQFFIFAALFQLSDAIQAPVQGSLRGYKDVNITFLMAIFSYWVIGLPVGYLLSKFTDFGPFGYWIGLIIGLSVGAITLSIRLLSIQKRTPQ